jgi:hypothetical protein
VWWGEGDRDREKSKSRGAKESPMFFCSLWEEFYFFIFRQGDVRRTVRIWRLEVGGRVYILAGKKTQQTFHSIFCTRSRFDLYF